MLHGFPTGQLFLIAGPCVLEDDDLNLRVGEALARLSRTVPMGVIYKASFDKANRSGAKAPRGPGMDEGLERLARVSDGWNARKVGEEMEHVPGADERLASPRWRAFRELCGEIAGLPRHLSQHPGGMVISSRPLVELVPVEPAAMAGRQNCQWDKDSCADAGFLKIDLLGLGMLSAVEECVEQIALLRNTPIDLSRVVRIRKPCLRATYDFEDAGALAAILRERFGK